MVGGRRLGLRDAPALPAAERPRDPDAVPVLLDAHHVDQAEPRAVQPQIMPLIVHQPTLKHYVDLITETNFLTWTYNTMLVAVVSTAVSLVLGTMIAYPLARMNFPGVAVVAIGVAATYLVPQPLLFIPMSDIINRLGSRQYAPGGHADVPDAPDPVLRVAPDGLFQERPARARGGGAHRRREPPAGHDPHRPALCARPASCRRGSSPSRWPRTSFSTR